MAVSKERLGLLSNGEFYPAMVSPKKFTLSAKSDTVGIIDPQSLSETTVRAFQFRAAGTISVIDPFGNEEIFTISQSFVDSLSYLTGEANGVGTAGTITAQNIICCI